MLYLEADGQFQPWTGQPIDGMLLPRDIEAQWDAGKLALYGLYVPLEPDPVPAGKVAIGQHVERLGDGAVRFVNELADFEPSSDDLDVERERRIGLPLALTVSVGTLQINMDPLALRNLQGLASVGQYLAATNPTQVTSFRAYDNQSYDLLPADLVAMGLQVAQRIQACYAAQWALKELSPIPADYADDAYWPDP